LPLRVRCGRLTCPVDGGGIAHSVKAVPERQPTHPPTEGSGGFPRPPREPSFRLDLLGTGNIYCCVLCPQPYPFHAAPPKSDAVWGREGGGDHGGGVGADPLEKALGVAGLEGHGHEVPLREAVQGPHVVVPCGGARTFTNIQSTMVENQRRAAMEIKYWGIALW